MLVWFSLDEPGPENILNHGCYILLRDGPVLLIEESCTTVWPGAFREPICLTATHTSPSEGIRQSSSFSSGEIVGEIRPSNVKGTTELLVQKSSVKELTKRLPICVLESTHWPSLLWIKSTALRRRRTIVETWKNLVLRSREVSH